MATCIFINYPLVQFDATYSPYTYGMYDILSRVFWAVAICYVVFACHHGYGGLINWFLSHPLWQPLSRLSYSIYLVHLPIIILTTATMKAPLHFSEMDVVSYICDFRRNWSFFHPKWTNCISLILFNATWTFVSITYQISLKKLCENRPRPILIVSTWVRSTCFIIRFIFISICSFIVFLEIIRCQYLLH